MSKITISDLSKSFKKNNGDLNSLLTLSNINLEINEGEFITFFGPNGCGKTTLINVLAGILPYDSGKILIDNQSPDKAKTGLVFQNYDDSLMPWLTCRENILFPYRLKVRREELKDAELRLDKMLSELDIQLPLENYSYQLSGGQKQLTSILRTLLYKPDVILMDEPFSALDFQARYFMQKTLLEIWRIEKPTIIFISHDIEEAIFLANRLVLLSKLPATIVDIFNISFEHPRNSKLIETDEFFEQKKRCLSQLNLNSQ